MREPPRRRPCHAAPLRRLAGTAVLGLVLLAGCTGVPAATRTADASAGPVARAPASHVVLPASRPTRVSIPAIEVDARSVIGLGLRPDGTMEAPPDAATVGWYAGSPTPGERGPAVLAGHVDWKGREGVFHDLRDLKPGDSVIVDRADRSTVAFRVLQVAEYPKDRFPTRTVYGDVGDAELRLITCGGEFDRQARSYTDNVVVYARISS